MDTDRQQMMDEAHDGFKYYAFISYNSKDTEWGKRVQHKLEHYRMPATLCSERGWKRKPINPVFFAPTDIQPGGLNEEIKERLKASRNLIVIYSPNSAKSEWVGKEIEYFHSLNRTEFIHFFIVDGVPHSGAPDTECFNPIVDQLGLPEILGANIHEKNNRWPWLNKERAYVQLISKLLGVEFDSIWQRHKRQLIRKGILWTLGVIAVIAALVGVWIWNQPFDAHINLNETTHNDQLPPLHDAVVTLSLDNETKTDTISALDDIALFSNIPHRYLGKTAHISFTCPDYLSMDTIVELTRNVKLDIRRDPDIYGNIRFGLWDGNGYVSHSKVSIAGHEVTSDANGIVTLTIPLEHQQPFYVAKTAFAVINDTVFMPCGENDVLIKR